jgi:hypothetical protein
MTSMKIRLNASNQQLSKFLMSIALSGKKKFARDAVLERLLIVLENASFWINSARITIQFQAFVTLATLDMSLTV